MAFLVTSNSPLTLPDINEMDVDNITDELGEENSLQSSGLCGARSFLVTSISPLSFFQMLMILKKMTLGVAWRVRTSVQMIKVMAVVGNGVPDQI